MTDRKRLAVHSEALEFVLKGAQAYTTGLGTESRPSIDELFDRLLSTLEYYTDDLEGRVFREVERSRKNREGGDE